MSTEEQSSQDAKDLSSRARIRARIGSQFRRQREIIDKSLKQVEADLKDFGFSASMLSRIENGETGLEHAQVLKLCSFYGLEPKLVYGLEEEPYTIFRHSVIAGPFDAAKRSEVKRIGLRHDTLVQNGVYKYLELVPQLVPEQDRSGDTPHQLMSVLMLQVNRADEDSIVASLQSDESYHDSEEYWYVLDGDVELFYCQNSAAMQSGLMDLTNVHRELLRPGDSVYLSARGRHAARAPGEKPAQVVLVIAEYPLLTKRQIEAQSGSKQNYAGADQ